MHIIDWNKHSKGIDILLRGYRNFQNSGSYKVPTTNNKQLAHCSQFWYAYVRKREANISPSTFED